MKNPKIICPFCQYTSDGNDYPDYAKDGRKNWVHCPKCKSEFELEAEIEYNFIAKKIPDEK